MSNCSAVLMFHAIGETSPDDWADRAYAFSRAAFLDLIEQGTRFASIASCWQSQSFAPYVLTFDDGHISNYEIGLTLAARDCSADFFINPLHVGSPYYMSWTQLRELADAGHSIQSHGLDHRFLSECDDQELQRQLQLSKSLIEQHLGHAVTILAPPGGRYDQRCVTLAQSIGYRAMAISAPGHWRSLQQFLIPRIAVMEVNSVEQLLRTSDPDNAHVRRLKIKYQITGMAKKMIGDSRYDRFRNWWVK